MTREIDWDQNQLIKPICPGWKVFFKSNLAVLGGVYYTPYLSQITFLCADFGLNRFLSSIRVDWYIICQKNFFFNFFKKFDKGPPCCF